MIRPLRVSSERIEHMPSIADQIGTGDPAK
jgi:hypothetical protein